MIEKTAEALKKEIEMPEWAKYVKTGPAKKNQPLLEDWYFQRAASMLRKIYMKGPIGVSKLRVTYGSKKNRGHKPERFREASGKIIRTIFQQLEKKELIKQGQKGSHKGRVITPKGRSFLDKLSKNGSRRTEEKKVTGNAGASAEPAAAPTTS